MGDRVLTAFLSFFLLIPALCAQTAASVRVTGHINLRATTANDLGRAESTLQMNGLMLMLKPTAAQQADLDTLLKQQQDPASPSFHQWLTPEQYADRFGAAQSDIDNITAWLRGSNLSVLSVARGRNEITFSGNVRDVETALSTEIHRYNADGESHFANATEPAVPARFAGLVLAIHGLHDFRPRARARRSALTKYTSGSSGIHTLGPGDIAAIYNLKPLFDSGISGKGQKLAIVGQTDIQLSDIESFRSFFGLPANDPQVLLVPNSPDPGTSVNDEAEADLDLEFSGAAARDATIIFVNSNDVDTSVQYAIDQNLAPVVSMSYGDCESAVGASGLNFYQSLASQANAQGITWLAAAGDSGAADCYEDAPTNARGNTYSNLAVDAPGSIPGVTSVGGSEMNEGNTSYFAAANDITHSSVSVYIPEMAWNDSTVEGAPDAGGGGVSAFFAKPSWQTGPGVPADGFRDVPDVSLDSSNDHDPRWVYSGGSLGLVGGTSVAAPTMAGVVALLNQYTKSAGQGNINPRLYAMAQSVPAAFHDIVTGNNIVNGCTGIRNCTVGNVGYNAGPGYDQATGLGSIDAFNLVTNWTLTSTTAKSPVTLTLTSASTTSGFTFTASVTAASGTPTGTVTFVSGGSSIGTAVLSGGTATLTVASSALANGFDSISAEYSGDATFASAGASISLGVYSNTTMAIQGITNAASYNQAFSAGEILSIFGDALAGSSQSAATVPLPTTLAGASVTIAGITAPLYFASPTQINAQIPYETTTDIAPVTVKYNGNAVTSYIPVSSYSPGIFLDSTGAPAGYQTAKRGQTIALYITGQGAVTPQPADGALPASGTTPKPQNTISITVGGIQASTPYAFIGIPAWAIGLTQVNFTIPSSAPLGSQQILVAIGGAVSAPATITITN